MNTQTAPLIEVQHVSKIFGIVIALKDISMSVQAGEVMCLLGDNGAGKSTLIKILSGVHQHSEGRELLADGRGVLVPFGDSAAIGREIADLLTDDLRRHALIHDQAVDRDPLAPTWAMWLKAAGVTGAPAAAGLTFSVGYMALDAAIAGHGVVLAYSTIAAADLAAGRLVRLFSLALPDLFAYYIVTAPGASERPKVRAFRDWLRDEADSAAGPALAGRS